MNFSPSLEEKINRHRRFWSRAATDRPMIGIRMHTLHPLETFKGGPRSGVVTADQLHAEDYFDDYERLQRMYTRSVGDEIHAATAFYGIPWLEAILGCRVEVKGSSMWAESFLHDWSQLRGIAFDPNAPWFLKLLEMFDVTTKHFEGQMPVGLPILRGPGDLASAIRGNDQFCMDLILAPDKVTELLEICTEAYLRVTQALFERCNLWHGGYVQPFRHIWAPGPCVETQADVSSLISAKHYLELLRPWDARLLGAYKYIYIHLHASSVHILDEVLSIRPLAAIEFSLDVGGPRPFELLGDLRKILSKTPLILQGYLSPEEIIHLCELLPSEGFYILALEENPEAGNQLILDVQEGLGMKWIE